MGSGKTASLPSNTAEVLRHVYPPTPLRPRIITSLVTAPSHTGLLLPLNPRGMLPPQGLCTCYFSPWTILPPNGCVTSSLTPSGLFRPPFAYF